jgi:hypothetical protein
MKIILATTLILTWCSGIIYYTSTHKESKQTKEEYIEPTDSKTMPTAKAIIKNGGYVSKLYVNRFFDGNNVCYIYGDAISCLKK